MNIYIYEYCISIRIGTQFPLHIKNSVIVLELPVRDKFGNTYYTVFVGDKV
jgi:hypothetical protein